MMTHSKRPLLSARSPLFQAIAIGLIAGSISLPTFAQSTLAPGAIESRLNCDSISGNFDAAIRCRMQADAMQSTQASTQAPAASPAAYTEQGVVGKPETWLTAEFKQDWGLGAINAQYAYARGLSGEGIRVGIFDSGVALKHPEFAGKDHRGVVIGDIKDGKRCAPDYAIAGPDACFGTDGGRPQVSATYWDPSIEPYLRPEYKHLAGKLQLVYESHGTHVAGTIAANRDGKGMHGVAFGANFSSARLFADTFEILDIPCAFFGMCSGAGQNASVSAFSDMYSQMNAQQVRAINHSWGLGREPTTRAAQDALYNNAANRQRWEALRDGSLANGMIQVWAAGNTSSVIASPDRSPIAGVYATLPRYMPELEKYWLSVVNVSQTGNTANPYVLSNRSMKCGLSMNWCVAAPGSVINSSVDGGESIIADLEKDKNGNFLIPGIADIVSRFGYADYSGTSMAAPHVTGALALLFQRYPYLTNPQVRDILLTTATDMGAPGVDEIYGWGMIDLKKAIEGYGQFRVDTDLVMNQKAGGVHVWNDARVWDDWTNNIGGPGRLSFNSSNGGWLRLSGSNTFNGLTVKGGVLELTGQNKLAGSVAVDGGLLMVSGAGVLENAVTVNAGGALGGTGTIKGNTTVFGTMAPGASIGTLTVNGNYVQQAGSRFVVEMQPPSATDKLVVNGTATLNGGNVVATRLPGVFGLGQSYNFLTASGGVNGKFAGVDNSALGIFLQMALRYDASNVYADVIRAAALASVAGTPNQRATSTALDGLPNANSLLQALVLLPTAAQANNAFDQLSGEAHGSLRNVLLDDSRHLRNAALNRARSGHDAFTGQSGGPGFSAWASVMSNGGALDGNANTAQARYNGLQWLVGGDYQFDGGWRIGALGGKDNRDASIPMRDSKADIDSQIIGVYAGQRWGGFGVQAGYTMAQHTLNVTRNVVFANFREGLQSRYDGRTQQAFIEGGYLFGGPQWQFEPYLQYANVRARTDGFNERSGTAALTAAAGSSKIDVITGGLRFSANLKGAQQEQTWLSLRGGLGYRQASGDLDGANRMQFAGSTGYTVLGAPIAKSATIADVGIAARTSEHTLLELGYSGQFSSHAKDHGATARFSIKF